MNYIVRWAQAGKPSIANVTIVASNDKSAIRQADKVGKELGVSNTPRTIYEGGRRVENFQ